MARCVSGFEYQRVPLLALLVPPGSCGQRNWLLAVGRGMHPGTDGTFLVAPRDKQLALVGIAGLLPDPFLPRVNPRHQVVQRPKRVHHVVRVASLEPH